MRIITDEEIKELEVLKLLKPIIKASFVLDKNEIKVAQLMSSVEANEKIKEWVNEKKTD